MAGVALERVCGTMLLGKGALVLVSGRGQNNWARWTFDSIT